MEIQTSKNHYYQINPIWTFFNFILWIMIWSMFSIVYLAYLNMKVGLNNNENVFYLLFIFVFLLFGIKQSYGNFYPIYKNFIKKEILSKILGELHIIPAIIYFLLILFSKGQIIYGWLLKLSITIFSISFLLMIYIYISSYLKGGK